jgi:hypothetical protein
VRLVDLEPAFLRREIRACAGYGVEPDCITMWPPHTQHEHWTPCRLDEADGISFLCPKCWLANGGGAGTHQVLCWRPHVPPDVDPKPGRWELVGTGFADLTLTAGSSSVALRGGCAAHFFIESGEIRMC